MDKANYPQRKHPRITNYDYSTPGYYFVTICTHDKACIFGAPNHLNPLGKIAQEGLEQISSHFPGVAINKYVVMPNHVHAIVVLSEGNSDLSAIIGSYKSYMTRQIHKSNPELEVWQSSFHDHVIRDQRGYERIWLYIEANPRIWKEDCFYV